MKNKLFVKTTAPPITTTRSVFYPLVNTTLNYLEKLKICYTNWKFFLFHLSTRGLYTLFKYQFSGKISAKIENVFDYVQRAISFKRRNRGVDKMPSNAKKRLLRKKSKQHFMSALQMNKSAQTSGSVFAERTEKAKKTEFELELIKIVDCFIFGHGNYDSNSISFKIKSS